MTNILPQEYKKGIRKEYRLRLLTVITILLFCALLGAIVLLIPSYIMSGSVEKTLKGRITSETGTDDVRALEVAEETSRTARMIAHLETKSALSPLDIESVVRMIVSLKPQELSITRLAVGEGTPDGISVSGIADTRNALLLFVERLRAQPEFKEVELPVSNLAQESDISFAINFKTALTSETPTE